MFRKHLISLLLDKDLSIPEIARATGEKPKDVAEDLKHLLLSLRHGEYELEVFPAECRKCGFEFSTQKLMKPSKCPQCRSTWIFEPRVMLRLRESAEEGTDGNRAEESRRGIRGRDSN